MNWKNVVGLYLITVSIWLFRFYLEIIKGDNFALVAQIFYTFAIMIGTYLLWRSDGSV